VVVPPRAAYGSEFLKERLSSDELVMHLFQVGFVLPKQAKEVFVVTHQLLGNI
jgi:hypothetical protein